MDVNNLKCPECKKIFQSEINLQRHLDKKICQKVFICTHCEKKFKTRLTLDRHVEKGICKNVKKKDTHFECKDCKKIFACKQNLLYHERQQLCLKRKNTEESSQQNKRLKNERDILVAKILEQYRKEKKEQQEPTCSSFLTPDKKTTKVFTC